ncbi:MAG: hypothetical protein U9R32_07720, partial [Bacteroidota bacterium]|nr:hypothetical protein [Bacteroidota bacterium]
SVVHGMMAYFGQTSHSISKLFIPEDYDIVPLLESFEKYKYLSNHNKYLNNYEYYKSIYLINREKFFDNEIILAIPNNEKFISPLGVIYFSFYKDETDLLRLLSENSTMYRFVYGNNNGNRKKIEEVYFSDLFYGDDNAMCINVLEQNL